MKENQHHASQIDEENKTKPKKQTDLTGKKTRSEKNSTLRKRGWWFICYIQEYVGIFCLHTERASRELRVTGK